MPIPHVSVILDKRTEAALATLMILEDVNTAEAFRRLVGYGNIFYRSVVEDGAQILTHIPGSMRTNEIVLLGIASGSE
jgi:hypothetical protein